jgi:hypothetical protein
MRRARAVVVSIVLTTVACTLVTTAGADSNAKVSAFIAASTSIDVLPSTLTPSLEQFTNPNALKSLQGSGELATACDPVVTPADAKDPVPCYFGDPHGVKTVVLYGDSNAGNWIPALNAVMKQLKYRLAVFAYPSCATPFIPTTTGKTGNYPIPFKGKVYGPLFVECATWHANVGAVIDALDPVAVIAVSGPWMFSTLPADETAWTKSFAHAYNVMTKGHPTTLRILLGTSPLMPTASPQCLSLNVNTVQNCSASYTFGVGYFGGILARDVLVAKASDATLVPVTPLFCSNGHCSPVVKNYLVYVDQDHTTIAYTTYVDGLLYSALQPLFKKHKTSASATASRP